MRVLLAEDDALLAEGVRDELTEAGYTVDWFKDGRSAQYALETEPYSIVLLDLGLPRLSGLDLLRRARARNAPIPVLVVTARDTLAERVEGLDCGADDYLVKPFDLEELKARMRALIRRGGTAAMPVLRHGGLTLDPAAHKVEVKAMAVELSVREFSILHELLLNVGRVVSRERLERSLYSWDDAVESNTLEVFLHRLRKKLGGNMIHTVRGVGYMIDRLEVHDD